MKSEFDASAIACRVAKSGSLFETFLDRKSLAAGVLALSPGQEDTQEPHASDEVYYIMEGTGVLRVGKKEHKVRPGMAYYVRAGASHCFCCNKKRLSVLYFFGAQVP